MGEFKMFELNSLYMAGRLGRSADERTTPTGRKLFKWGMVSSRSYKDASGEWVEIATWVDCEYWPRTDNDASRCIKQLVKGKPILVEGKLQQDTWEDNDGNKRSKLKVVVNRWSSMEYIDTAQEGGSTESKYMDPPAGYKGKPAPMPSPSNEQTELPSAIDEDAIYNDDIPF